MQSFFLPKADLVACRLVRRLASWLLVAGLAPAIAQSPALKGHGPAATAAVTVQLSQIRVVKNADGKELFLDASEIKPGDVVEYKATYTNRSGQPVRGLVANLPIPDGLQYMAKSAKPGAALVKAATKDGVYAAEPLTVKVGAQTELVPYADYRMLRWDLGLLPANGVTAVSARAAVQSYITPAAGVTAAGASLEQTPPVTVVRVPAKP